MSHQPCPHTLFRMLAYISALRFPKAPCHCFPVFLLVQILRRAANQNRFLLLPIPNKLYELLLRHELIQSEHVMFMRDANVERFVASRDVAWVNMTPFTGNQVRAAGDTDTAVQNLLGPAKLQIVMQTSTLPSCPLHAVLVKENFYANYVARVRRTGPLYVSLHELTVTQKLPRIATKATITLHRFPYDLPADIVDLIVSRHFDSPRLLHRNHCYEARIRETLNGTNEYARYFHVFSRFKRLFFRCTHLASDDSEIEVAAIVVRGQTTLITAPPIDGPVPRQLLDDLCFVTACPAGLQRPFDELCASVAPFMPDQRGASLLAEQRIYPAFLLQGERGSGRTTVCQAVALRLGIQMYTIDCAELVTAVTAQTEAKLRLVLAREQMCAPLILCLLNFEVFAVEADGSEDLRLLATFTAELHELFSARSKSEHRQLPFIVVAATSERTVRSSVQRLFVETITIEPLDVAERHATLEWLHTRDVTLRQIYNGSVEQVPLHGSRRHTTAQPPDMFKQVAERAQGFLYGDLCLLYDNATKAKRRADDELAIVHFDAELEQMQQAFSDAMGAPRVPRVLWSDIGGLARIKDEIQTSIGLPMRHAHLLAGVGRRSGILLYGPPGTGKTLIAKAVATECNLSFLAVQGPELLNMYVGQSEHNVREVFARARAAAPCIVFLDELDSLAPNRGAAGDSGGVMDRVVSQLLAEMDGIDDHQQKYIFILAATNRPDLIDPALLRPGRFDKLFYVGPYTTHDDKTAVLCAQLKHFRLAKGLRPEIVADLVAASDMTGADLYAICSNAWLSAVRRNISSTADHKSVTTKAPHTAATIVVTLADFQRAVANFIPSLNKSDLEYFRKLKESFATPVTS